MRQPLAALCAASVLWGAAVSGTKYALAGFGPVTLLSVELVAAALLLWAALLRESITPAAMVAVLVALGGLVVLAGAGEGHGALAGDLLVAPGVLSASLYSIVAKRFEDGSDVLSLTAWQFTAAAVVALTVTMVRRRRSSARRSIGALLHDGRPARRPRRRRPRPGLAGPPVPAEGMS
jgi:drug/metabolite transporter (DMT)-like permease